MRLTYLEKTADNVRTPTHVATDMRRVARENLHRQLRYLSASPVLRCRRAPGRSYYVLVFDTFGVFVDPDRRIVQGVQRSMRGGFERVNCPIDLLDPMTAPGSLRALAFRLGMLIEYPQRQLFCSVREARVLDTWMMRRARAALLRDERYREVMRVEWPRKLGLDEKLIDIALRSRVNPHRRALNTREFTRVWKNARAFRVAAQENPRLLPLLGAQSMQQGFRGFPEGEDPIAFVKKSFIAAGVSQAAWRYVCRHGARVLQPAWRQDGESAFDPLNDARLYLLALQGAGLPPPPPRSIALKLAQDQSAFDGAYLHVDGVAMSLPDDILALALRQADRLRRSPALAGLLEEMQEATRWPVFLLQPLDANQKRAGWPAFMRRMRRETGLLALELSRTQGDWRTTFQELEFDGLRALPIASRAGLDYEAQSMRNCLSNYAERCRLGLVQVISFRDAATGRTVGDAAYERQPLSQGVTWRLEQAKEFANNEPGERIRKVAMACEDVLNVIDLAGPREVVRRRLRSGRRVSD